MPAVTVNSETDDLSCICFATCQLCKPRQVICFKPHEPHCKVKDNNCTYFIELLGRRNEMKCLAKCLLGGKWSLSVSDDD